MKPLIEVLIDGRVFAQRNWDDIPRVGDTLILKDGEVWVTVNGCYWSNDSQVKHEDRLWIQLDCTLVKGLI